MASRPKLPSELHPDYPKKTGAERALNDGGAAFGKRSHAFYQMHPEFQNEGDYEFRCEMCGGNVDTDYEYCAECGDHSGSWVLVDADGEEIEGAA